MNTVNVKLEIPITVEMGTCDIKGTSLQRYLPRGTRYKDIVRIFGNPQLNWKGTKDFYRAGKTHLEWIGKINGLVFTIYDYKSGVDPKNNTDWHIGGRLKLTADVLKAYFQSV